MGAGLSIGVLNESPLHASLKQRCAQPGDTFEAPVDGYVVDILRGDLIIEVQTAAFSSIAQKLRDLTSRHRVRLVHPVARERWLLKLPHAEQRAPQRRRSPRRGGFEQVFEELVSIPDLLDCPNFELEVVATHEEEVRRFQGRRGRGRRRRGWVTVERRLLDVVDRMLVREARDLLQLLPPDLADPFDTAQLASALGKPRWLAQKAAYCLRESGALQQVGKHGNLLLYARAGRPGS